MGLELINIVNYAPKKKRKKEEAHVICKNSNICYKTMITMRYIDLKEVIVILTLTRISCAHSFPPPVT